jgi:phosphate ABC transporter permease subunit PstA
MSTWATLRLYFQRIWAFVSEDPRESNTEGGIFPAIFGTVMMVFLMSFFVAPLGVLAALYLREYAKQGPLVGAVRIAVNNLAGVPSIVFGVFGLGFFVYLVGGTIDRIFYADALPTATFGTGGILWASLTLALLTVPVVIVASEEGLAAVPRVVREGSLALGATKFETTWRVVLPAAAPGILTGMILAMARAAGEVAPLGHEHARSLRLCCDDLDMCLDERGQPFDGVGAVGLLGRSIRRHLERGGRPVDDRPEEIFLGRDVGVEAGALDVERPGDVADARRCVAVCTEQLARHVVDLAPPRAGLEHQLST